MMCGVGELMTLDLPPDSPLLELPWILTIAPASEDADWDPIVFGPYEREHALALGAEVVDGLDLVAVVEPIFPHVSAEAIAEEIAVAQAAAVEHAGEEDDDDTDSDVEDDEDDEDEDHDHEHIDGTPSAEDVRAGIARVAARLLADHLAENVSEA
jgi:hypothetical protein